VLLLLFSLVACKDRVMDTEKVLTLPVDMSKTDLQQTLELEAICGGPLGHDAEIKIRWNADKDRLQKQRIDLSVHKNGMAEGRYTSMFPGNEKAGFKSAKLTDPKFNGRVEAMPALDKLKVKSIGPDTAVGGPKTTTGGGSDRMVMTLSNFEPGLNYFVRILRLENDKWVPGPVVRVEAPVCPRDEFLDNQR
jgi:hypothetical protein